MDALNSRSCKPCEGGVAAMDLDTAHQLLAQVPQWKINESADGISRQFTFKNYYQTMAFVNALAWIAHREDHHPDIEVGYKHCLVKYSTHAVNGLSENDFICAAKIDDLTVD
ncbi:MAG: 4a-hydroxytetrahydrobiopterin dehydratase [Gammaproteobacteria bacterium]|nr:4a-hydroxytetrahydrobiopterin dehydratase [Gammaproteobacteria bacterium]